jgi:hypothetical protein
VAGNFRNRLTRLEARRREGVYAISQPDGTVHYYTKQDAGDAFLSACNHAVELAAGKLSKDIPVHPMVNSADNSSDPFWRESSFARMWIHDHEEGTKLAEDGEVPDLSEPGPEASEDASMPNASTLFGDPADAPDLSE